jgi:hypothetical protein
MHDPAQEDTASHALDRCWRKAFLTAIRQLGNVRAACDACGIGRRTAYSLREADPTFAADWDEALEDHTDLLEAEVVRRAMGTKELVIHQGKPCGVWVLNGEIVTETTPGAKLIPLYQTRYSDTLIQFELRGRRPRKYNPPRDEPPPAAGEMLKVIDLSGADGGKPTGEPPEPAPQSRPPEAPSA